MCCHYLSNLSMHCRPSSLMPTMNANFTYLSNVSAKKTTAFWNILPNSKWFMLRSKQQQTSFEYITVLLKDSMTMSEWLLDPMLTPKIQLMKWPHELNAPMNSSSVRTLVTFVPESRAPHTIGVGRTQHQPEQEPYPKRSKLYRPRNLRISRNPAPVLFAVTLDIWPVTVSITSTRSVR